MKNLKKSALAFTLALTFAADAVARECQYLGTIGQGGESAKVYKSDGDVLSFVGDMDVNTDGALSSYGIEDLGYKNANDKLDTNSSLNVICNGANIRKPNGELLYGTSRCYDLIREFKRIRKEGWLKPNENFVFFYGIEVSKKTYVEKPDGKKILRGVPCEKDGFYVSQVAKMLPGGTYGDCKPEKWLDALKIPAIVVPRTGIMADNGVGQHDLAIVRLKSSGDWVGAIVGDTNDSKVGEATVNLAARLRGKPLPSTYRKVIGLALGAGTVEYIVFPGTAGDIPDLSNSSDAAIQTAAKALFEKHAIGDTSPVCP
ncbi:glycoside hydrolase family 75 protein [Labrenzia sp. VG12]|uniref:glycoside hydrolase family 75 protein n=1 Tax=Labrenzia sp. VG12 TaxID=2021862 RepID=UPI000B8C2EB5|nr:glycoside hydrolase family 75 protein [Labrenzia sp. VG12]ASP33685.1 hypothetical protein CHH27_10855 [Labrenzia sp. VG12]